METALYGTIDWFVDYSINNDDLNRTHLILKLKETFVIKIECQMHWNYHKFIIFCCKFRILTQTNKLVSNLEHIMRQWHHCNLINDDNLDSVKTESYLLFDLSEIDNNDPSSLNLKMRDVDGVICGPP